MIAEQVNLVCKRCSSESSHQSAYSDYSSDGSNKNEMNEPLLKVVKCTMKDFICDVDTGAPIRTEYDCFTEMNNISYIEKKWLWR